jgi:hypothetical protein
LRKIVQLDRPPLEAKIGLQPQELEELGISCYLKFCLKQAYQKILFKASLSKENTVYPKTEKTPGEDPLFVTVGLS